MTKTAMGQHPSWRLKITLVLEIVGILAYTCSPSLAQITPDATLGAEGSVITPNVNIGGFPADFIQGGATRGANLFHSFSEFNVGNGQRVYFANPAGIETILTRVTGNTLSNILGTLGVTGRADLFLLNPNGIIFGPNARLDVGGSFVATTANSFVFGDGLEFSATNPATPPLLTISVPLGLQYGPQPGALTSQGILVVNEGQSLILAGGEITLDDSYLAVNFFEGGRVELAAVAGEGIVGLNADGNLLSLSFPDGLERADVSFTNGAGVDVRLNNGGDIAITARNIDISGESSLLAGIYSGLGSTDSQAGDITLDATGTIRVDQSTILNALFRGSRGNAGDIRISTGSLSITNGSQLVAATAGRGNAGNIIIDAHDTVSFEGVGADGFRSGALSFVQQGAVGRGGNVEITAGSLLVTNRALVNASTFGQGDAGNIIINVRDTASFLNDSPALSYVGEGAVGNGGNIYVTTGSLFLTNGSQLDASVLNLGRGNAGNIIVNARDTVSLDGMNASGERASTLFSEVDEGGVGNGGNVIVTTGSLFATNGARLEASTEGQGNAGNVIVNARDIVQFSGTSPDGRATSGVLTDVVGDAVGSGGNVEITTGSLFVTDGARLQANTEGQGNAGNVTVNARDIVQFDGVSSDGQSRSAALSNVRENAVGTGGNVEITTGSLLVTNGAELDASTEGQGSAGNIIINARDRVSFQGVSPDGEYASAAFSRLEERAVGNGGNIEITTKTLSVTGGAQLQAETLGQGNAGNVIINASESVSVDGFDQRVLGKDSSGALLIGVFFSSILGEVGEAANGSGGDVRITTGSFSLTNGARLNTSTSGQGNAGNIQIDARDSVLLDDGNNRTGFLSGLFSSTSEGAGGRGGTITVNTDSFNANGVGILAQTSGAYRGGDVTINTRTLSLSDRAQISASSQGTGQAGAVAITATEAVRLTNSDITTSAPQAAGGAISITTDFLSLNRARITAATGTSGAQGAANITLQGLELLLMGNESLISANALNQANGGNVAIDSTFIVATPPKGPEGSDITANAFRGRGGKVSINTQGLYGIEFRPKLTPENDITVSSEFGLAGVYEQSTPGVDPSRGLAELPTNVVDASEQIDRRCTPRGANQGSSFIITGRGGLPPSPNDPLQGESVITNWVNVDSQMENNTPPAATTPSSSAPRQLVEAQGWVINEKGQVVLTEQAPSVTPTEIGFLKLKCNVSNQL